MKEFKKLLFCLLLIACIASVHAQDTLNVMSYNVLNYGDGCQGSNATLHAYLRTIIQYSNPDVLGLVKMESAPVQIHGFADSVNQYVLNAVFPDRYAVCPYSNVSTDDKTNMLFYNQNKLVFLSMQTLVAYVSDFNLYKFYYKNDPHLSTTQDTTFLYVVLNHTKSGTSSITRDQQMTQVSAALQQRFTHLPNVINMGDFNLHSTEEAGYQALVAPTDTNYTFYDTPFYPDQDISYPALWESNATPYAQYMTTSTRQSAILPNTCGTSGGAKDWFDHILLSSWITQQANYVSYIPHSYQTIGNDGHRLGISENDSSTIKNTSAPDAVVEALYQFSNKYPITLQLVLHPNETGESPKDPDKSTVAGIENNTVLKDKIVVTNPVGNKLLLTVRDLLLQGPVTLILYDALGREVENQKIVLSNTTTAIDVNLVRGIYFLQLNTNQGEYHTTLMKE